MSIDRVFTFDCVEKGNYTREYSLRVISHDAATAEQTAGTPNQGLSGKVRKDIDTVIARLVRVDPVTFDSVLDENEPAPPPSGPTHSGTENPILAVLVAIEQALDGEIAPEEISQAIRNRFPVIFE